MTMPCVKRRCDGLVIFDEAEVAHDLGPEARIDEVQDGVLDAANVLVDGEPVLQSCRIEWSLVVVRVGVAIEVPGRIDESVHGVGLAPRRASAFGAGGVDEVRHPAEGRAALLRDLNCSGSRTGNCSSGTGTMPSLLAIEHGDGRAPVALPADAPIFQAKGDRRLAKSVLLRRNRPFSAARPGCSGRCIRRS